MCDGSDLYASGVAAGFLEDFGGFALRSLTLPEEFGAAAQGRGEARGNGSQCGRRYVADRQDVAVLVHTQLVANECRMAG